MMKPQELAEIFGRFAGKEVAVDEIRRTRKHLQWDVEWTETKVSDSFDPTITSLKKMAVEYGFKLRLWLPSTTATPDYSETRLNVHLTKGEDGKYRIGNQFNLG